MKTYIFCATLILTCLNSTLFGLTVHTKEFKNKNIFAIEFPNNLSFYGKAGAVTSTSLQEYQTGAYVVTEMVIDLSGTSTQVRIYNTELLSVADMQNRLPDGAPSRLKSKPPAAVQKLLDTGKQQHDKIIGERVVKDYPTTTHAKTIEFRLSNKAELIDLYDSFITLYIQKDKEVKDSESDEKIVRLGGTLFRVSNGEE